MAHEAGAYAPYWLVVVFLLLLSQAFVLVWAMRCQKQSRDLIARGAPSSFTGKPLLWAAIVVGASAAFVTIAFEVAAVGAFLSLEQAFSATLQDMSSTRTQQVFAWLTRLGDGRTLALLGVTASAVLLWRRERVLALGLVAAIGGNALFNTALKHVFERMRPPHEPGLPSLHGWGFPSAHTSGSVVAYGILAYVLMRTLPRVWHLPVVLLATVVVCLVGASRLILEAHFAGDVLAGLASGTAWLGACILSLEMLRDLPPAASADPPVNAVAGYTSRRRPRH